MLILDLTAGMLVLIQSMMVSDRFTSIAMAHTKISSSIMEL